MDSATHNAIVNLVWGIAGDVSRDIDVRGKYRGGVPPMTVLRRLDTVPGPNKKAVLDMKAAMDREGSINHEPALRHTAGQAFYNTSKFTLRDLKARTTQQQLKSGFEDGAGRSRIPPISDS